MPASLFAQQLIIATTDNPSTSLHVFALNKFKDYLENLSNKEIRVQIHYRDHPKLPAVLGEEFNVRLLIKGESKLHQTVHMTVVAAGNLSHHANVFEFLMLPYLFETKAHAVRLFNHDQMMAKLNKILVSKHGIRALAWLIGDYRHLTNSHRAIHSIKDLKGLRIRTPVNEIMHSTYAQLGAKVVPLPWRETFSALRLKRIDGQENPYSVVADSKFWLAHQKYIADNGTFLWTGPMLINENFYQSLSHANKKLINLAAKKSAIAQWNWSESRKENQIELLKKHGLVFTQIKDKEVWINSAKTIWPDSYKKIGYGDTALGKALVEEILAIVTPRCSLQAGHDC